MAKRSRKTTAAKVPQAATVDAAREHRRVLRRALQDEREIQKLAQQLQRARRRSGELLTALAGTLPVPFTTAAGK